MTVIADARQDVYLFAVPKRMPSWASAVTTTGIAGEVGSYPMGIGPSKCQDPCCHGNAYAVVNGLLPGTAWRGEYAPESTRTISIESELA